MLYELEGVRSRLGRTYQASDITMIVAVRLHEQNPWIVERITSLGDYYTPPPAILVVDFGSEAGYREQVAAACRQAQVELLRVEDAGLFSLSKARNCGAIHSRTSWVHQWSMAQLGRDLRRLCRAQSTL